MTYGIDLMIFPEPENILKMVEKLKAWGYKTKVPVGPRDLADEAQRQKWIKEKGTKAMSFYSDESPLAEIDLLFDLVISYLDLKKRAVSFEIEGGNVPTISIHDLIQLKKEAGRKQDLSDVSHLKLILEDLE